MTLKIAVEKLIRRENLNDDILHKVIEAFEDPEAHSLQIAAFLVLLRCKRETVQELCILVNALRHKMHTVPTSHVVLDIVGTGGDGSNTINISTGSAMLAASCGIKIAKHGNRSVSSLTGSADVVEALGIKIQLTAEQIARSIHQVGIGFCYAPNFHPLTYKLRNVRKQLNVPTTFNFLGPLLNPVPGAHLLLGVADKELLPVMADVLVQLQCRRSLVVHGMGIDEVSCMGPATIIEVHEQEKRAFILDPEKLGFPRCTLADLRGGDAQVNAQLLRAAFQGKKGPIADTLVLNAALALYIYGTYPSLPESIACAQDHLANRSVMTLLDHWIDFTHVH